MDRQGGDDLRHPIAERAVLLRSAHAHRHERADAQAVRIDGPLHTEAAEGARHGGQHDVVQRATELVLTA
jgi:hypothetical protein